MEGKNITLQTQLQCPKIYRKINKGMHHLVRKLLIYVINFDQIYCTVWNHIHPLIHYITYSLVWYILICHTCAASISIIMYCILVMHDYIHDSFAISCSLMLRSLILCLLAQTCLIWQWASLCLPQPFNLSPLHLRTSASMRSVWMKESVWWMKGRLLAGKCFFTALITLWTRQSASNKLSNPNSYSAVFIVQFSS